MQGKFTLLSHRDKITVGGPNRDDKTENSVG